MKGWPDLAGGGIWLGLIHFTPYVHVSVWGWLRAGTGPVDQFDVIEDGSLAAPVDFVTQRPHDDLWN